MKLLFVTNSIPFPPRNGVELPLAHLVEHMVERHQVDLLVLAAEDRAEAARTGSLPRGVRLLWGRPRRRPPLRRVLREMAGRGPGYFQTGFELDESASVLDRTEYDLAWVTPVSEWGFVRHRGPGPAACTCCGPRAERPYYDSVCGVPDGTLLRTRRTRSRASPPRAAHAVDRPV